MKTEKLKSLIDIELLEHTAQQQIYNNLNLPFLEKLVIMPDCHTGYLLPIGGVALLNGVISPEYTGYDIGCGMCSILTDININDILKTQKDKDEIFDKIYETIPVGPETRKKNYYEFPQFKSASGNKDLNKRETLKENYEYPPKKVKAGDTKFVDEATINELAKPITKKEIKFE